MKSVRDDLKKNKNMTPHYRMRTTLTKQIEKEKELEEQATQQQREWFREGNKS
jgi:hypothetical protein